MHDTQEIRIYSSICSHDGIKAREIAKETGVEKSDINRLLYSAPFIRELCYRDDDYLWHGLIRQNRPHVGLADFCGYYGRVEDFLSLTEEEWLEELENGCRNIGRNLNDTRGLIHSFRDSREVMIVLFSDLEMMERNAGADTDTGICEDTSKDTGEDWKQWEICFELRIKRARHIRIYADVLVITQNKVFSLEFKMKDRIDAGEVSQAAKYVPALEIIVGEDWEIVPVLVLTRAAELFRFEPLRGGQGDVCVCSGDMLFNAFDAYLGFLKE